MEAFFLAAIIRPFVFLFVFVGLVAPLTWLLYKIIPNGRIKVILFSPLPWLKKKPTENQ